MTHHLRGTLLKNACLAQYTTWQVGGPAKVIYQPADIDDLSHFLKTLPEEEPLLWLGGGSNVLISDEGFSGTVILIRDTLNDLSFENNTIYAETGVRVTPLAHFAARQQLTGLAFLAGIPGTVGGALAMNAGAEQEEIWQKIKQVETINRSGERFLRSPKEYIIQYRSVKGPLSEWFTAAYFELPKGDTSTELNRISSFLKKRQQTQPLDLPNAGSIFRNPKGDYAARLIEASGLKGYQIGSAKISEKHANFIINLGKARASDIERLMNYIAQVVENKFKIELVPEVKIIR